MKLADLIDRLVEIHNSQKDYNPEVTVMTEIPDLQIEHNVTDVAVSRNKDNGRVIIIGQELD